MLRPAIKRSSSAKFNLNLSAFFAITYEITDSDFGFRRNPIRLSVTAFFRGKLVHGTLDTATIQSYPLRDKNTVNYTS